MNTLQASTGWAKPPEGDRNLLLGMAQKMAGTRFHRTKASN